MGGGTIFLIIVFVLMAIGGIYYAITEQQKQAQVTQHSANVSSSGDDEVSGGFFAL